MTHNTQSDSANRDTAEGNDAIAMLVADHQDVKELFEQFHALAEGDNTPEDKADLVRQICAALEVHCHLEEEIFYPAVREAIGDADLMDKALVEQAGAKELVAQLEDMHVGDDLFDAKVMVLAEQVTHHAAEEEQSMFPQARKAMVDTAGLGAAMATLRAQLKVAQHNGGTEGRAQRPAADHRRADGR